MNSSTKIWIGQVTTGHGFMLLAPTLLAVLSGTMTWAIAFPLLVAGVVGLMWPENAALEDVAKTMATEFEAAIVRVQGGVAKAAASGSLPPDPRKTAACFAVLAALAFTLSACSNQTPAQQAAEIKAIECIADTTAKVAQANTTKTSNVQTAANTATALGTSLATDPACSAPVVSAPAAAPAVPPEVPPAATAP